MGCKKLILLLLIIFISFNFVSASNSTPPKVDCGGAIECNCGDSVTNNYTMTSDLNCSGVGLYIADHGVKLDCNGYTISGSGPSPSHGICINNAIQNTVVQNCNVQTFDNAIIAYNAYNNIITNNNVSNSNHGIYLYLSAAGNNVTNNIMKDNFNYEGVAYLNSDQVNHFWGNIFINSENGSSALSNQPSTKWNISNQGNDWSDFEENEGYPYHYNVSGSGYTADFLPEGGIPSGPTCFDEVMNGDEEGVDYDFLISGNYTVIFKTQSGELEDTEELHLEVI